MFLHLKDISKQDAKKIVNDFKKFRFPFRDGLDYVASSLRCTVYFKNVRLSTLFRPKPKSSILPRPKRNSFEQQVDKILESSKASEIFANKVKKLVGDDAQLGILQLPTQTFYSADYKYPMKSAQTFYYPRLNSSKPFDERKVIIATMIFIKMSESSVDKYYHLLAQLDDETHIAYKYIYGNVGGFKTWNENRIGLFKSGHHLDPNSDELCLFIKNFCETNIFNKFYYDKVLKQIASFTDYSQLPSISSFTEFDNKLKKAKHDLMTYINNDQKKQILTTLLAGYFDNINIGSWGQVYNRSSRYGVAYLQKSTNITVEQAKYIYIELSKVLIERKKFDRFLPKLKSIKVPYIGFDAKTHKWLVTTYLNNTPINSFSKVYPYLLKFYLVERNRLVDTIFNGLSLDVLVREINSLLKSKNANALKLTKYGFDHKVYFSNAQEIDKFRRDFISGNPSFFWQEKFKQAQIDAQHIISIFNKYLTPTQIENNFVNQVREFIKIKVAVQCIDRFSSPVEYKANINLYGNIKYVQDQFIKFTKQKLQLLDVTQVKQIALSKNISMAKAVTEIEKINPYFFLGDRNLIEGLIGMCLIDKEANAFNSDHNFVSINNHIRQFNDYLASPTARQMLTDIMVRLANHLEKSNSIDIVTMYLKEFAKQVKYNQKIKKHILDYETIYVASAFEIAQEFDQNNSSNENMGNIFEDAWDAVGDALEFVRDQTLEVVRITLRNTIGSSLAKDILPSQLFESLNSMSDSALKMLHGDLSIKNLVNFVENAVQASLQPMALASHYVREIADEALKLKIIRKLDQYSGGLLSSASSLVATADQLNQHENINWEAKGLQALSVGLTITTGSGASILGTTITNTVVGETSLGKTALGRQLAGVIGKVATGSATMIVLEDTAKKFAQVEAEKALVKTGIVNASTAKAVIRSTLNYYDKNLSIDAIAKSEAKTATKTTLINNLAKTPIQRQAMGYITDKAFDYGSEYYDEKKVKKPIFKKDANGNIVKDKDGNPIVERTETVIVERKLNSDKIVDDARELSVKIAKYQIDEKVLKKYGITVDDAIKASDKVGSLDFSGSFSLKDEIRRVNTRLTMKYEKEYKSAMNKLEKAKDNASKLSAEKELDKLNAKVAEETKKAQDNINKVWAKAKNDYKNFDWKKELGDEWGSIKNDPMSRFDWLSEKYGDKFLLWLIQKYGPKYNYKPTAQDYIQFQDFWPMSQDAKKVSGLGKILLGLMSGAVAYTMMS